MKRIFIMLLLMETALAADPHSMRPRKARAHGDIADVAIFESATKMRAPLNLVQEKPKAETKPSEVKKPKVQVLVFTATWCGPCQGLTAEYEKLKMVGWRVGGEIDHVRVIDADKEPGLLRQYQVDGLPTLIRVEDGVVKSRWGFLTASQIAELYYGRLQ